MENYPTYLEIYDAMVKTAETDEEVVEERDVQEERVETITKYSTLADNMLAQEFGDDYNENDVKELTVRLIDHDSEIEEMQTKVAEYVELGTIMAKAFKAELANDSEESEEEKAE